MFSNILVPLDGTAESNAALPLARAVAQATGGTVTLLRVVKRDDASAAAHELQRIRGELAVEGPAIKSVVRESGDVGSEITQLIQGQAIDLVIMRAHGRVGIERAVLGSVTQQVLAASRVPVMLMRPDMRGITQIRKLMVPVDGSPGSTLALGTAVELSRVTSAPIYLLQVSVPASTWVYAGDAYGVSSYDPAWEDEALASARTYVEGIVKRLRATNVEADGEARQDAAVANAIVSVADGANADVIVMSTRALTGPARALMGSTADAVVRAAHCPVLLIHRTQAAHDVVEGFELETSPESVATPA